MPKVALCRLSKHRAKGYSTCSISMLHRVQCTDRELLPAGLDARAAAIVMRSVRAAVDTGRTVVATIHQPSIDIFESFDNLLLMKARTRACHQPTCSAVDYQRLTCRYGGALECS